MAKKTAVLTTNEDGEADESLEVEGVDSNPKMLVLNIILTIAVIGALVLDVVPSYLVFMVGLNIALIANYPLFEQQDQKIKDHAPSALAISATMLAAGVMVGIMNGTGMLEAMEDIST